MTSVLLGRFLQLLGLHRVLIALLVPPPLQDPLPVLCVLQGSFLAARDQPVRTVQLEPMVPTLGKAVVVLVQLAAPQQQVPLHAHPALPAHLQRRRDLPPVVHAMLGSFQWV